MRALKLVLTARRKPRTGLTDEIVTPMIAWPGDIDLFMKINKGRYLTLMDISRLEFCYQIGVMPAVKGRGWGFAVAGSSIRYRKRYRYFATVCHTCAPGRYRWPLDIFSAHHQEAGCLARICSCAHRRH